MFSSVIELFYQGDIIGITLFVLFPLFWLLLNQGIEFVYIINILPSVLLFVTLLLGSVVVWRILLRMYISSHYDYNDHVW